MGPMTQRSNIGGVPSDPEGEWKGTARYEVVDRLGWGGMGVVYEVLDRERGERVALKTLQRFTPAALYLFKLEFRTLADVHHTNLVRLHEMVCQRPSGIDPSRPRRIDPPRRSGAGRAHAVSAVFSSLGSPRMPAVGMRSPGPRVTSTSAC